MITEQDLQEAIAECKGVRNPNASTCIKLAAFLTIQKELYGKQNQDEGIAQVYASVPYASHDAGADDFISYLSDTDFSKEVNGLPQYDVMKIMDELMSTLEVVQPRVYASVLRKIREIS